MSIPLRIVLIVLVLSALLAGMIAKKQYTLATGTPILLETQPIDPRSLFRGDFVRLNYAISDLKLNELEGDDEFRENDTIYVVLEEGKAYWQAVSVHRHWPDASVGQLTIKGRVVSLGDTWQTGTGRIVHNAVGVEYGIEDYFVPEGEGRDLERPSSDNKVDLRIAVDRFGNSGIQAVLVNGEERYRETLL